jgi:hypothetical protein
VPGATHVQAQAGELRTCTAQIAMQSLHNRWDPATTVLEVRQYSGELEHVRIFRICCK